MSNFTAKLFAPFYSQAAERYLSFCVGRHPLFKQFRYLHFTKNRSQRYKEVPVLINPLNEKPFMLLVNQGLDFHRHSLFYGGIYERHITELVGSFLPLQDIFIDVGACIGYYTLLAAAKKPDLRILSIEPAAESFDTLTKNIAMNNASHVEAVFCAAGSEKAVGLLNICPHPEQNSLLSQKQTTQDVAIRKIDDMLDVENKNILVKIDTEGYEYEVIKGMKNLMQKNNCTLIFEFNPEAYAFFGKACAQELLSSLKNNKYTLSIIESNQKKSLIEDLEIFLKKNKRKQIHILAKND